MEVTQLTHQQDWKELRQTVCKEKLIIIFSLLQALITIFEQNFNELCCLSNALGVDIFITYELPSNKKEKVGYQFLSTGL